MSYNEFVEFHKKHPNMDNTEYYAEFPDVNKSTIRSWKSRARTPVPPIEPKMEEVKKADGYEEQTQHYIEMLMTQTQAKPSEFEGIDDKSKILIKKMSVKY